MGIDNPKFDNRRLRKDRLSKLQAEMSRQGVGALLLVRPDHIRYATDVTLMPIWTALNAARYAFVPVEGEPQLFEYGKALFRAQEVLPNSKAAMAWQYRFSQHQMDRITKAWAGQIKSLMLEHSVADLQLGVDPMDPFGYAALGHEGIQLTDADTVFDEAQLIKTDDEILIIEECCSVAETSLSTLKAAIQPGVSEYELMAAFWGKMLSLGGEYCSTRLLVSGEKTNPWFYEAGERRVRPGDLVAIDTDMIGPGGYLCDVSRTFLCGTKANADQREAFHVAYDFIYKVMDLIRPGIGFDEIMRKTPHIPEAYVAQGYSCMIHGCGMDDEPPFFPFPVDAAKGAVVPLGAMKPGMVLSVEFYAGKVGGREGVKLEEQVLVTETGNRLLARFPFEEALLN